MKISKFVYFVLFSALLVVDQVSKHLALNFLSSIHFNESIFLGSLNQSTDFFRVTFLATTSVYLCMLYLFLMDFLSAFFVRVKIFMTLIFGGVVGNIIDRLIFQETIDFIPFFSSTKINFSDIFITLGFLLLVWELFRPAAEVRFQRTTFIINKKDQWNFATKMALGSFLSSVVLGVFTYSYVRDLNRQGYFDYQSFLTYFAVLTILSSVIMFIIGIIVSHKMAGPVYAFEQYILAIARGEEKSFHMREGDNFQHLRKTALNYKKLIDERK